MNVLINPVEIAEPLAQQIIIQYLAKREPSWSHTLAYINKINKKLNKSGLLEINFTTVNELLLKDLQQHAVECKLIYKKLYRRYCTWLGDNLQYFTAQEIAQAIKKNNLKSLTKIIAPQISNQLNYTNNLDNIEIDQEILIRNVLHNEQLLAYKFKSQTPFWFIDSGYTNFLDAGWKSWHRLVKNHIHHQVSNKTFPADRLHLFSSFPKPWRHGGGEILVVENSEFHYRMFGTTLEQWRQKVSEQLAKYTDRPVRFRSKHMDKKSRDSLYQDLLTKDYYCVITDASAAAIEAVWAGVPIITLNRHISQPVARTSIKSVENLYRGCVGDWLCALSYYQFTVKEFVNGTAMSIIQEYHLE